MEDKLKLLSPVLGDTRVKFDIDISKEFAIGLGGVASAYYIATSERELATAVQTCLELKINFLIIGSGSKVALTNEGKYTGLVIKNRSDGLKIAGIKGKVSKDGIGIEEAFIEAGSGVSLKKLAEFADEQKLGGLELLKNSPGTIGGSLTFSPLLQERTYQIRVLTREEEVLMKKIEDLVRDDILLTVVFKLKKSE